MSQTLRSLRQSVGFGVLLVGLLTIILISTGTDPIPALSAAADEAIGDMNAVTDTLALSLPLVVVALGTVIAFRGGMFNLGGEGQFIAGALAAAVVGVEISGLAAGPHIALTLMAGALAGGLAAGGLAALRAWVGVDEVLSTLMANFMIVLLAQYLVTNPLRDPSRQTGTTRNIEASARFGTITDGSRLTWALVVVLALIAAVWWILDRSRAGYVNRMVGLAPVAAHASGLPVRWVQFWSMALCGAVIGVGGAIVVTASQFRFWGGIGAGLGFTAVLICLLASNRPLAAVVWSLLYTMLRSGARGMELETGVPSEVTQVALAVVLIAFAGREGLHELAARLRLAVFGPKGVGEVRS